MVVVIGVCQGSACSSRGGDQLLRDIEELCGRDASAEPIGCLGRCGNGPNCEVTKSGKKSVKEKVKSFREMEGLLTDEIDGWAVQGTARQLAKLKFELRREDDKAKKKEKIAEGLAMLGPEEEAIKKMPRQYAEMLVIRARTIAKADPENAIRDAQQALALRPAWVQGHLALAAGWEALGNLAEAVKALTAGQELTKGSEHQTVGRQVVRLQGKIAKGQGNDKTVEPLPPKEQDPPKKKGTSVSAFQKSTSRLASRIFADEPQQEKSEASPESFSNLEKETPAPTTQPDAPASSADWTVESVHWLNHNCIQLSLAAPPQTAMLHDQGDVWHVDVTLETDDGPITRAYTPMSSAEEYRKGKLELMVKVYPDGKLSPKLAELKPGELVFVPEPVATLDPAEYEKGLLMVAGGSAVTVGLQVTEAVLKQYPTSVVYLIMCNRTYEDVLFDDKMEELQRQNSNFHVIHCLSQSGEVRIPGASSTWKGGHLDYALLRGIPSGLKAVVSGPPGLCRATVDHLTRLSWPNENIRVLDELPPPVIEEEPEPMAEEPVQPQAPVPEPSAPVSGWSWFLPTCCGKSSTLDLYGEGDDGVQQIV